VYRSPHVVGAGTQCRMHHFRGNDVDIVLVVLVVVVHHSEQTDHSTKQLLNRGMRLWITRRVDYETITRRRYGLITRRPRTALLQSCEVTSSMNILATWIHGGKYKQRHKNTEANNG
jgi:hypothetical protein